MFVLMAHDLAKRIHRKLNIAYFQCRHREKYTLNGISIGIFREPRGYAFYNFEIEHIQ